MVADEPRPRQYKAKFVKPSYDRDGYPIAHLTSYHDDGTKAQKTRRLHVLVTDAFYGPLPEGQERRHKNGDPGDWRLANLEFGTSADNSQDTIRHGNNPNLNKDRCPRGHLYAGANLKTLAGRTNRLCRACKYGDNMARKHGRKGDQGYIQERADDWYRRRIADDVKWLSGAVTPRRTDQGTAYGVPGRW